MKKQIICPKCNSNHTKKNGKRKTENRGFIQRYKCKSCNKRFVIDNGFFRMRNAPQKITLCLDLFFRGVSTRKVQEHLQAFYPQNSSHMSILRWVGKYSNMISKYTDSLKVNVGSEMQLDEMEHKTKGQRSWFIDTIDTKSRYMVSSDFSRNRGLKDIKKVLRNAKKKTGKQVRVVTTDGWKVYPKAIRNTFNTNKRIRSSVIHRKIIASEKGFNHKVERMHNNIRERTKIFRGFGSLEGAKAIMNGYEVYYNFIRKHQALNKCPYELAIPEMELGVNKWLDLISLSCG